MADLDPIPGEILTAALAWQAKLKDPLAKPALFAEFTDWLEADRRNRAAFDLAEDVDQALDDVLNEPVRPAAPKIGRWAVVGSMGGALLAACLVIAIAVTKQAPPAAEQSHATVIGERKSVTLADGSAADLNTNSALRVAFTETERRVELEHGEAVFSVAKDARRPFVVVAGDTLIRDIGTVFGVRRDVSRIVVTVAEGRVSVSVKGDTVALAAGDRVVVDNDKTISARLTDPIGEMSWRQGYLTYQGAPLWAVVADLNRYFSEPIAIADDTTGKRLFSGILRLDARDVVVKRLTELLPVRAEKTPDGRIILRETR